MGTSHSTAELVGKIVTSTVVVAASTAQALEAATLIAVESMKREAKSDAPYNGGSMRNWRRGAPIPLNVTVSTYEKTMNLVRPMGRAAGPWRVMNDGKVARQVGDRVPTGKILKSGAPQNRQVRRRQGAQAGKRTWDEGRNKAVIPATLAVRKFIPVAVGAVYK